MIEAPLDIKIWQKVGLMIRQFHQHQIYHADLNARNILIEGDKTFLIDFDQSSIKMGESWKPKTLERLKRSLLKIKKQQTSFYFDENEWLILLKQYSN